MGKEADMLFNVPVGTYFWTMEEHKNLIIAFFFPIISGRKRRGTWKIKRNDGESGTAGDLHTEFKRIWDSQGYTLM